MGTTRPGEESYDAVVLGAGVSGLTAAAHLARSGRSVCLLDTYPEPGGNHLSWHVGGSTFDIGSIFFMSDNPLFAIFPAMLDRCVPIDWTIQRVTPDNRISRYPFDLRDDLISRRPADLLRIALDVSLHKARPRARASADDFIRYYLGTIIPRQTGLIHYFNRFYGLAPSEISYDFAERRMDWISQNAGVRARIRHLVRPRRGGREARPRYAVARPRDGFAAMYREAVRQLAESGVVTRLQAPLRSARRRSDGFVLDTADRRVSGTRLISTIPLRRAADLFRLSLPEDEAPRSTALLTLFCHFRGRRNFDALILYNFSATGPWKRLTMHSDYYGRTGTWEYFSLEIVETTTASAPEAQFRRFKDDIQASGLFDGEVVLVGHARTEFAYPVYDHAAAAKRDRLKQALAAQGVELIGRQGLFEYIPASGQAVSLAQAALA
ncbi:hypothetical protein OPKNFCMD_5122 [Methylobacterium crusticola]|uniref:FAD-dependent oxidoreductase n=1 Tax=Methylobacterium crusticola TaxID=1697972 RepID=A0ABQ4R6H1_9HYPH|nr:FAD-dependent oxidoreductase [Methylobacterium crusticola]GJD52357.1 hypothetical protein OPKNFCMD_5122 [Methylobacterium crusticola]